MRKYCHVELKSATRFQWRCNLGSSRTTSRTRKLWLNFAQFKFNQRLTRYTAKCFNLRLSGSSMLTKSITEELYDKIAT